MTGDTPFCIDPHLLAAGAQFGETVFDTAPQRTIPTNNQFTPYGLPPPPPPPPPPIPQWPMRTSFDPSLAPSPSPPPSPTRRPLDPTAPPFTPRQSPPRLQVQTDVQQEVAIPEGPSAPLTPQITVSPADCVENSNAVTQAVRQLGRTRRSSSPGSRPTAVQRRQVVRRVPMPGLPTLPPAPVDAGSQPGRAQCSRPALSPAASNRAGTLWAATQHAHDRGLMMPPPPLPRQMDVQAPQVMPKTPVQPLDTAAWVDDIHTVGFPGHLHGPETGASAVMSVPVPATPTDPSSAPGTSRSRASSSSGRRPLVCGFPDCHHRARGKTFKTLGDLRKHERVHLPESARPLGCDVPGCERRFWWPKDRTRHVESFHNGVKFDCPVCGKELARADLLNRHLTTVHREGATTPRNWAAPSPSVSTETSFAATPRSEYSFGGPSTPLTNWSSSFASASRPGMPQLRSFHSIAEDDDGAPGPAYMEKSWTR